MKVRLVIAGGILILILAILIGQIIYWLPGRTVLRHQAAFERAIETYHGEKLRKLIADDYQDSRDYSADDVVEVALDMRSQFLALALKEAGAAELDIESGVASYQVELEVGGSVLGAGGSMIKQRINGLKGPFVFQWEKQSLWPGSWQVIAIENESIPADVWNYEPGSLRRMMGERP